MKNYKFLLAAILLNLTQIAWAVTDYTGTFYADIQSRTPKELKENSSRRAQILDISDIDFFEVKNESDITPFPLADTELTFSCPQSKNTSGWIISLWENYGGQQSKEALKKYDVYPSDCKDDKFSFFIDKNEYEDKEKVKSYYIGVQGRCAVYPSKGEQAYEIVGTATDRDTIPIDCDTSDYQLKLGLITKSAIVDTNTLTKTELNGSIPLGTIKTGQIKLDTDKNIYSVDTYSTTDTEGTNDVSLLFSCTAAAARQTNNWKLTVYDDKNTVVAGYPRYINGSDCGSTLVDDKGGFKFTLPKDSPRYFVSVQSACDSQSKKNCTVETSQYNIARDVTKIYTGRLSTTKNILANSASFKLTRCGVNSNSTIAVKVENADLREMFKEKIPMKIQIGTMACQILTPDSFSPAELMLGSITGNAEIIDAPLIAKDSVTVTLGECISSNKKDVKSKITLTGTRLDLENLNPAPVAATTTAAGTVTATSTTATPANNSVVIPVKVDIGDFHCEGRDAFYIDTDKPKIGDTTYSNHLPIDIEDSILPINLELSKTGSIKSATDMQLYYVDSSINSDTVLSFSCADSIRFNNDWKVLIYNGNKTLNGTPYVINGSDCATGENGDNGAYKITIPKDKGSMRYFVAVKSACDVEDSACKVDTSKFTLQRVLTTATTATTGTITPYNQISSRSFSELDVPNRLEFWNSVDYYTLPVTGEDSTLSFKCTASTAIGSDNGWVVTVWEHSTGAADWLQASYEVKPDSCSKDKVGFKIPVPANNALQNYFIGVQSTCLLPPENSQTILKQDADKTCKVNTSNYTLLGESPDFTTVPDPSISVPVKNPDSSFDTRWLSVKKNLGASQKGQINTLMDVLVYQVDTGLGATKTDVALQFFCLNSTRYQNDWKVLIYDSAKTLTSTEIINGSACGIGQFGDTGAYSITLPKDSATYYLVVKSACEKSDTTCIVDNSQYELKRVPPATTGTTTTPTFGGGSGSFGTPFFGSAGN